MRACCERARRGSWRGGVLRGAYRSRGPGAIGVRRVLVVEASNGRALTVRRTTDVLADAVQADLGGCALRVDFTRENAGSDVVLDVALGEPRILRGSRRRGARLQYAFAIRAATDVRALAGLASLEQRTLRVALACRTTVPGDAFLVLTVGTGAALVALAPGAVRVRRRALDIRGAGRVRDAAIVGAGVAAHVRAVRIGANRAAGEVLGVGAVAARRVASVDGAGGH